MEISGVGATPQPKQNGDDPIKEREEQHHRGPRKHHRKQKGPPDMLKGHIKGHLEQIL